MLIALPVTYIVIKLLYKFLSCRCFVSFPSRLFEIAAFLKYFLIPVLLLIDENYRYVTGPLPSDESFNIAIKISIYEMLIIYIFRYIYHKKNHVLLKQNTHPNLYEKISSLFIIMSLIGIIFLLLYPNLMFPKFYLFEEKDGENEQKVPLFSILILIWKKFYYIILLICINNKFKETKYSYKKSIVLSMLVFICFVYMTLGASRWGILFTTITTYFILSYFYGKVIKKIFVFVFPFLIAIMLLISYYKFSNDLNFIDGNYFQSFVALFASQLQSYFSGVSLIAQAVDMSVDTIFENDFTFDVLCNDFLGSIPFVNSFVNPMERTNIIFNQYVLSVNTIWFTQIIPASGIGYIYMGFWLSPVFTLLFNIYGLYFEKRCLESNDVINKFLLLTASLWCSLSICFNTQIVFGNLIVSVLSIYIAYRFFVKFNRRLL